MPSEENNLEQLLQDTNELGEIAELGELNESSEPSEFDELADLSAEDIEKKIAMSKKQASEEVKESNKEETEDEMDVDALMKMLKESDEGDLLDIHNMLEKSDNNERISEEEQSIVNEAVEIAMDLPMDKKISKQKIKAEKKKAKEAAKLLKKEQKEAQKAKKQEEKGKKSPKELKTEKNVNKFVEVEESTKSELPIAIAEENVISDDNSIEELLSNGNEEGLITELGAEGETAPMLDTDLLTNQVVENEIDNIQNKNETNAKKGFFAKIIDFLMADDEEPEEVNSLILSDENEEIIREMDAEDSKKKKKKDKKGKKSKTDNKDSAESEEESEDGDKKGKKDKKQKKEKKPKKEKAPKLSDPSDKKLSKKRVIIIFLICASFGAAIWIITSGLGDYSAKRDAQKAFYDGNYQECYQKLYGKSLNESEEVMYYKSESIMKIKIWIREYEILADEGMELKALDSLLQSVADYPKLYEFAGEWNASGEVEVLYQQIIDILEDKYHITEEQAKEICDTVDDIEYSKKVMEIIKTGRY